jgi:hypothetical protein
MTSYASILENGPSDIQRDVSCIIDSLNKITTAPESLLRIVENLRKDMEVFQNANSSRGSASASASASAGKLRNFNSSSSSQTNWRSGQSGQPGQSRFAPSPKSPAFDSPSSDSLTPKTPRPSVRYQSRFTTGGGLQDKILNSVIGNKLNSFTSLTYNDTRDFIYQIMDSGEKEFIQDFIEKVFAKATLEELYCALFAKLIAEIAHRYPSMYEEMKRYHEEFLNIFDDVDEKQENAADINLKKRQYRLGYGQFISELASLNALEKGQLLGMVERIVEKIFILSAQPERTKVVEEFVDCLLRLLKSLRQKSIVFFNTVKEEIKVRIIEKVTSMSDKKNPRASLSTKARFGLMDITDIILDPK